MKRPRFVLRLVSDCVLVTRAREEVCERALLLRIDCVSVSCFSRSRPLCAGRGVASDEEDSSRFAIVREQLV